MKEVHYRVLSVLAIILFVFFTEDIYAQKHPKYGIVLQSYNNSNVRITRKIMTQIITSQSEIYALESKDTINANDILLPDSICGRFEVTNIVRKRNNYTIKNKQLKRQTIFLIDIKSLDTSHYNFLRVMSPKKRNMHYPQIKKGHSYDLKLYPIFEKDCCISKKDTGILVTTIRRPEEAKSSYLYNTIWIPYIDIHSYNLCESPNIIGNYYVSK